MKRVLLVLVVMCVVAMVPSTASAVDCVQRTTSYWGYQTVGGGYACTMPVSPPLPPYVIGQRIRECDGYTWTWGHTSCTATPPTYEYEECPPCYQAESDTPETNDASAECAVTEVTEE